MARLLLLLLAFMMGLDYEYERVLEAIKLRLKLQ